MQKVLARAGYGSRREVERWIELGRLRINQRPAKLGDRISQQDRVFLDGKPLDRLQFTPKVRLIAYHKPAGVICSRDDSEGRETVFSQLPVLKNARWISVGRLDLNTSGLLLFTTDGELANRLMHPSGEIEREYAVRILGQATDAIFQQLQSGVELEDGLAHFDRILDSGGQGSNHWYHVMLKEGRNREVRRLWEAVGLTVSRLIRLRYGNIELGRALRSGKFRDLQFAETKALYELAGLPLPPSIKPHRSRSSHHRRSRR